MIGSEAWGHGAPERGGGHGAGEGGAGMTARGAGGATGPGLRVRDEGYSFHVVS